MNATTVSRLTSSAPSAIAVIFIEGPMALKIVSQCWRPNRGSPLLELNRIRFGFTVASNEEQPFDCNESIVVCRTQVDRVELHCHGGKQASEKILSTFASLGAVVSQWDRMPSLVTRGLIEQEAIEDLVHANTLRSTAILLDQMRGALSNALERIERLRSSGNTLEATDAAHRLQQWFEIGSHLIHPWRVVLAGPPNVGKSSLLNRMLGYERAIVHEQAGTTRDSLMERTSFDGWPIELVDGAGVRQASEAADQIEITGIDRILDKVREADCVLLMVDSSIGWTKSHERIYRESKGKRILIRSKSDLGTPFIIRVPEKFDAEVMTSALTGQGLIELQSAIVSTLVPNVPEPGTAIPFRKRHWEVLQRLSNL